MNSWLKQWKSQVIVWVCVKLLFCPSPVHSEAALMSERCAWTKLRARKLWKPAWPIHLPQKWGKIELHV